MPTIFERLSALTALDAVSGQEQSVVAHLKDALAEVADEVQVDAVGNLYAVRRGPRPGPTVLIAAHTDEIGLIVKAVEPDGFLRFDKVGGVLDNLLAARMVRVRGHLGVIGMRAGTLPVHRGARARAVAVDALRRRRRAVGRGGGGDGHRCRAIRSPS